MLLRHNEVIRCHLQCPSLLTLAAEALAQSLAFDIGADSERVAERIQHAFEKLRSFGVPPVGRIPFSYLLIEESRGHDPMLQP